MIITSLPAMWLFRLICEWWICTLDLICSIHTPRPLLSATSVSVTFRSGVFSRPAVISRKISVTMFFSAVKRTYMLSEVDTMLSGRVKFFTFMVFINLKQKKIINSSTARNLIFSLVKNRFQAKSYIWLDKIQIVLTETQKGQKLFSKEEHYLPYLFSQFQPFFGTNSFSFQKLIDVPTLCFIHVFFYGQAILRKKPKNNFQKIKYYI